MAYTLNNPTEEDEERLKTLECKYHVFGRETGESGTFHFQGCITFHAPKRFSTVKKILGERCYVDKVRKGVANAREYCKKDGDYWENEKETRQGNRTDLEEVTAAVKQGKTEREIAEEFPTLYVKYYKGLERLRTVLHQDLSVRTVPPEVFWIYGETGSGKTRYVVERESDLWINSGDFSTFNGYTNQPAVLFDDFRGSQCKFVYPLKG